MSSLLGWSVLFLIGSGTGAPIFRFHSRELRSIAEFYNERALLAAASKLNGRLTIADVTLVGLTSFGSSSGPRPVGFERRLRC